MTAQDMAAWQLRNFGVDALERARRPRPVPGPDEVLVGVRAVPFMLKRARLQGVSVGHRRAFERMVRFVEANAMTPVIDQVFSFEDVPAAFECLEEGPVGKVIVEVP